ncbi:MAG: DUF4397 domain-containing protein [Candidatus Kapaibacterium sp.]
MRLIRITFFSFLLALIFTQPGIGSISPEIQIIHNSPDPSIETIDIYIDGQKPAHLDDISFREATAYFAFNGGEVKIAESTSANSDDKILHTQSISFPSQKKYTLVITGVSDPDLTTPFAGRDIGLKIIHQEAKDDADQQDMKELNLFHGSPDLMMADAYINYGDNPRIDDLDYGAFSSYNSAENDLEVISLTAWDARNPLINFNADFTAIPQGTAAVGIISGFMHPDSQSVSLSVDYEIAMLAVLPDGNVVEFISFENPESKVQFIHNSPDTNLREIDIYLNDIKPANLDDLSFREATSYLSLPANVMTSVKIASSGSTGPDDGIIDEFMLSPFEEDSAYVLMIAGDSDSSFTTPVQGRDISLNVFPLRGEEVSTDINLFDFNVAHGSIDAPAIDLYLDLNDDTVATGVDYGESSTDYLINPGDYELTLTAEGDTNVLSSYILNANEYEGLHGVIFASGFLDPEGQMNLPDEDIFGLYLALSDGTVIKLAEPEAEVQLVHNAAFPSADTIDVYINDVKTGNTDGLTFRSATEFIEIDARSDITIKIAQAGSEGPDDKILKQYNIGRLDAGTKNIIMINGVIGEGYANPDTQREIVLNVYPFETRTTDNEPAAAEVQFFHGVTDAPIIDIYSDEENLLADNIDYGENSEFISSLTGEHKIRITTGTAPSTELGKYNYNSDDYDNKDLTLFLSGFLTLDDEPPILPDTYGMGLYGVDRDGNVYQIPEDTPSAYMQLVHNSALPAFEVVDIYINDQKPDVLDDFEFRTATPFLSLPAETEIEVKIALSASTGPNNNIYKTFTLGPLEAEKYYYAVAAGIDGQDFENPVDGRDIQINVFPTEAHPASSTSNLAEARVFNGITDLIPLSAFNTEVAGGDIFQNLDFGEYSDIWEFLPDVYFFRLITSEQPETFLGLWEADFSEYAGESMLVFISGFHTPSNESVPVPSEYDIGVYVAFANGNVISLPEANSVRTNVEEEDGISLYPNPAHDQIKIDIMEDIKKAACYNLMGERIAVFDNVENSIDIGKFAPGTYYLKIYTKSGVKTAPFVISR